MVMLLSIGHSRSGLLRMVCGLCRSATELHYRQFTTSLRTGAQSSWSPALIDIDIYDKDTILSC